jgi:cytochrome c553
MLRIIATAVFSLLITQFYGPTAVAQEAPNAALCLGCHGAAGRPADTTTPVLHGQHFYYLYVQLKDYKAKRRDNPIMSAIAAGLSRDDMKALAQVFSEGEWPNLGFAASEETRRLGTKALASGQCVQCHRGGYEGDSRVPRLAGQQVDYLEKTMLDFKNKVRMNSPAKGSLLGAYSEEEIRAMAEYLAAF